MDYFTEYYPVPTNARVLILNISAYRPGCEYDVSKINATFGGLEGFEVKTVQNFTAEDIKSENGNFAAFKNSLVEEEVDALFMFVMAHGGPDSAIHISHSEAINFKKDILRRFSREATPELSQIPKVFVINACRGLERLYPSWGYDHDSIPGTERLSYDNIFILYSTQEGYVSLRHEARGSYCVQILCELISKYSTTMHLMDIFTKATSALKKETKDNQQITEYISRGWGKFFFFTQQAKQLLTTDTEYESQQFALSLVRQPLQQSENRENVKDDVEKKLMIADLKPGRIRFNLNKMYARLLYKVEVATAPGKSKCYKFILADNGSGLSEIEAVAFNATGLIFHKKINVGCCVELIEANVEYKSHEFLFGLTKSNLQLKLFNHSMNIVPEISELPTHLKMNITPLKDVQHKRHREIIDVIGVVDENLGVFGTPRFHTYREIILRDSSKETFVSFKLWGKREDVKIGSLIYIRDVRVVKPSQINAFSDDSPADYDIKTDHQSVAQQSVLLEINDALQLDPAYREMYWNYLAESDGEPRTKIARTN